MKSMECAAGEKARAGEAVEELGQRYYVCCLLTNRLWRIRDSYPRSATWVRTRQSGLEEELLAFYTKHGPV